MNLLDRLRSWWVQRDQDRAIRRHGWTGIYVGDYRTAPTWAYTIGLDETLGHPEIVVFDAPQEAVNALFWRVFEEIRTAELVIEDGLEWPVGEEGRAAWRKVHPDHVDEWLTFACMRRASRTGEVVGLAAYQFVLADAGGHLPWEPGYDEGLRHLQKPLWQAPETQGDRV